MDEEALARDVQRGIARYRGYWDNMWFRIGAQPYIQSARIELKSLMSEYAEEPSEYYFEELAREVAYECAPHYIYDIEDLAELYPYLWEKADELDDSWGPGDEHSALRWAIGYCIFTELFDLLPTE